jgi:hypothetical protein
VGGGRAAQALHALCTITACQCSLPTDRAFVFNSLRFAAASKPGLQALPVDCRSGCFWMAGQTSRQALSPSVGATAACLADTSAWVYLVVHLGDAFDSWFVGGATEQLVPYIPGLCVWGRSGRQGAPHAVLSAVISCYGCSVVFLCALDRLCGTAKCAKQVACEAGSNALAWVVVLACVHALVKAATRWG